jgi:hypothetical protein
MNGVTDGIVLNRATNQTFIKPSIEAFTGEAFAIGEDYATQYINIIAPRFENSGGVGTGIHNYALAQSTLWVGGMTTGLATDWINDTTAPNFKIVRPNRPDPESRVNRIMLADADNTTRAMIKAITGTVYVRNAADSAYAPIDTGGVTSRGQFNHTTGNVGFYGTTPIAKQTSVPVTAAGVHAALVALGLIT